MATTSIQCFQEGWHLLPFFAVFIAMHENIWIATPAMNCYLQQLQLWILNSKKQQCCVICNNKMCAFNLPFMCRHSLYCNWGFFSLTFLLIVLAISAQKKCISIRYSNNYRTTLTAITYYNTMLARKSELWIEFVFENNRFFFSDFV